MSSYHLGRDHHRLQALCKAKASRVRSIKPALEPTGAYKRGMRIINEDEFEEMTRDERIGFVKIMQPAGSEAI